MILIQEGKVVVLKSDTSKHILWKLAIIKELLKDNDGQVRAAVVKVTDSHGGTKLLRRSIKHLFPNNNDTTSVSKPEVQKDVPESLLRSTTGRPRHRAAVAGEETRRNFYK